MKRKLRELGNPSTTFLIPPLNKAKTKGRPSSKNLKSTRRDPSLFEVIERDVSKREAALCGELDVSEKREKLTTKTSNHAVQYLSSFPSYVQPYIRRINDVKADGHCGFRAIAGLLGFGEDNWLKVREELIEELCNYRSYYVKFYESSKVVAHLLETLSCSTIPAPYKNWMDLPDMGHLVATRYNVVLVHISMQQCWTYLPLRSNPPPQSQLKIITIGYVNKHFVQVFYDFA